MMFAGWILLAVVVGALMGLGAVVAILLARTATR